MKIQKTFSEKTQKTKDHETRAMVTGAAGEYIQLDLCNTVVSGLSIQGRRPVSGTSRQTRDLSWMWATPRPKLPLFSYNKGWSSIQ